MHFPKLKRIPAERLRIERFGGLDRRPDTPAGSWRSMENLTGDDAPFLRVRPVRTAYTAAGTGQVLAALGGSTPVWLFASGELSAGGRRVQLLAAPVDATLERRMALLGGVVCVWPDKRWADVRQLAAGGLMVEGLHYGALEQTNQLVAAPDPPEITLTLCDDEGAQITDLSVGTEPPEAGRWLDVSCTPPVLRGYSAALGAWIEDTALTIRIAGDGLGIGLHAGDGVELDFAPPQTPNEQGTGNLPLSEQMQSAVRALNGSFVLLQAARDELRIAGSFLPEQDAQLRFTLHQGVGMLVPHLRVRRSVPGLDFVVACGNRLWGCRCGTEDGRPVNAIYASKLGDGRNWNVFAGTAADSYRAERGESAPFTGAAVLGGNPLFFREASVEKVFPAASGAHQILTQALEGVQEGSWASCAVLDDALYYQSRTGVCRYAGTLPQRIGAALGGWTLHGGVAAFEGRKYYLSALDASGAAQLLVFDTERGLWHREDGTRFTCAITGPDGLVYADAAGLRRVGGSGSRAGVGWYAETGELLGRRGRRLLVRLRIVCRVGLGASARLCVSTGGVWRVLTELPPGSDGSLRVQCSPLRCERLRLRLEGRGDFTLESLTLEASAAE